MMTDQAVSDASVVAHWGAYKKGIIHGDISDGNVLIYPVETWDEKTQHWTVTRRALLADWELSKWTEDRPGSPRQPDRTVSPEFAVFR